MRLSSSPTSFSVFLTWKSRTRKLQKMVSPGRNSWSAGRAGPSSNWRRANFSISIFAAAGSRKQPERMMTASLTLLAQLRRNQGRIGIDLQRNLDICKMPGNGISVGQLQAITTQGHIEENAALQGLRRLHGPQYSEPVVHTFSVFQLLVNFSIRCFQFQHGHGHLAAAAVGGRKRNHQESILRHPGLEHFPQLTSPDFFNDIVS